MSIVCGCLAASELFAGAVSLEGKTAVSIFGGELPVAWLSRSSASRSLLCRASSSCACVLTACFLEGRLSAEASWEGVGAGHTFRGWSCRGCRGCCRG